MQEHPAARQLHNSYAPQRSSESSFRLQEEEKPADRRRNSESDAVKLGDLPDFLVYVFKARKYDPL